MTPLHIILVGAFLLLGIGLYGLLIIRNMIKIVIAIQIMVKGAMMAFVVAGSLTAVGSRIYFVRDDGGSTFTNALWTASTFIDAESVNLGTSTTAIARALPAPC